MAARAAGAVLERQWQGGRLFRVHQDGASKVDAFLEDWGGLAAGLVALYQATFEPRWLEAAVQLADGAQERFWDAEQRAYRTAPRGQADLSSRRTRCTTTRCPRGRVCSPRRTSGSPR